jgi:parallel beta-helix repeat protein
VHGKFRVLLGLGIAFVLCAGAAFQQAKATSWYVDGANGSDSGNGSQAQPFKTWQHLFYYVGLNAGDTVHLLPTTTYMNLSLDTSGTASQPITITGDPNTLTKLAGDGTQEAFYVGANYITVEYFDIVAAPGQHGGITVSSPTDAVIHDVIVTHNIMCNAGFAGISTTYADHITISHNTVCNNARDTANNTFASGISMWDDRDSDTGTGIKMIVDSNIVYGNTNVPNCPTCQDTDGNGIIVDDNRNTQTDGVAYHGTTEIMNNVVYGNGGNGIEVYSSDNVIVTGNTTYHNNQDATLYSYNPGEIELYDCGDVTATNNIAMSDGAARSAALGNDVSVSLQHCSQVTLARNLGYNDAGASALNLYQYGNTKIKQPKAKIDLWGNPLFVAPSLDPTVADFRVAPGSPALKNGDAKLAYAPYDILGVTRKKPLAIGAYQNAGP